VIVVDASALLAIYLEEAEAEDFRDALVREPGLMSPVNLWEAAVRAHGLDGAQGVRDLRMIMDDFGIAVAAVDAEGAWAAVEAFTRFGRRTPANLNLGDCFAYALAAAEGLPLLYKGDDFPRTDVRSAL
jgi:ribonuclease VapC